MQDYKLTACHSVGVVIYRFIFLRFGAVEEVVNLSDRSSVGVGFFFLRVQVLSKTGFLLFLRFLFG